MAEYFNLLNLSWNITKAKRIVADGREPTPQPTKVLRVQAGGCERRARKMVNEQERTVTRIEFGTRINWDHVPNVDPAEPGIAAYGLDDYILIDGHHRVVQAEQLGMKTVPVYFLTPEESDSCLTPSSRKIMRQIRNNARRRSNRGSARIVSGQSA